ncbi:N-acetylmuramoyl-L-alanine amidase [Rossellomorea sp. KS-H15a]|uniref:N-acetylmuramoyl-L-alanine amidase n=1 Tax=Rossellomorea sp. KS-H15a TaxID=2963940 RepID=UPI0020C6B303|nr:N-acetylmuramoyl-L-alanine amidase [Rossellomorea sp. KS-H15a]UTE77349.1 N-acetylmuramoyl-L-alanine amidase [Rossellomorea sp. KS-H15a]
MRVSRVKGKLTLLLVVVLFVFGMNQKVLAGGMFLDVDSDYWAKSEIEYLHSLEIINGYDSDKGTYFNPDHNVTRAQAAKMLVMAKGQKETSPSAQRYKDVPLNYWAAGWIEKAAQLGYFDGKDDGTFDPNGILTRAQMSKILANAFGLNIEASSDRPIVFSDIKPDFWASTFINSLYYNGITDGTVKEYRPQNYTTRAQFSVFLSRAKSERFKLAVEKNVLAKAKVTASTLNVRSAATSSASQLGRLNLGDIVKVYSINGYWAEIEYNSKKAYVHKTYLKLMNTSGSPLKNRIIVVDAGHGGRDSGATNGGIYEKSIVMDVTNLLVKKLEAAGAKVLKTRENDGEYPTLEERVEFAEDHYAELFLSIHVNASYSPAAKGTETYYNSTSNDNGTESFYLAREIQEQMINDLNTQDRGVKDAEWYVIKYQEIPAVLLELGFISNIEDLSKLTSSTSKEKYAEAIYKGIVSYYNKY